MITTFEKQDTNADSSSPLYRSRLLLVIAAVLIVLPVGCVKSSGKNLLPLTLLWTDGTPDQGYRQAMREFVQGISSYARGFDAGFIVIPQNGIELVTDTGDTAGTPVADYLDAISGVGQEDLYYGYNGDNVATPSDTSAYLKGFLDITRTYEKKVLAIDYCSTTSFMDDSYSKNNANGYISFAANHRGLDNIPAYPAVPYNVNASNITMLADAQNFLYLINPSAYDTKANFLGAMQNTNYDVVLIDLFFNDGSQLSSADVDSLKKKNNGGDRLVICYMSIGEAENYRYYWQPGWFPGNPPWLGARNPSWPGNYKVRYWDPAWQAIIYGDDSSYLKKIMDAGFDGVYLDIIDAFDYWENHW
ncbi:MAG TPA: endo alpha-1,4 polygalactosaminidase [Spirochaetota bacterium]|nr:endo alpha-1,4 polygalactosaminidase [Spirochaetota bacterium]HPC43242.1 endo alpha-1,4 polygalactosaminidase [Spirochaetota bacterium]HPL19115.1 endo alpha-1,4 polygalactosaminidase [Spirochaetota bacterium]HQF10520.1 endo alpha-1,4 polygalactosaminidase [Spirochaetota bacterium]HQH96618.1 endo alpha-1,4 polygalactosaminidase [Spirochaetota bacterium]